MDPLAHIAAHPTIASLIDAATPIMNALMQRTGESVQLYRLTGTSRTCIASKEPPSPNPCDDVDQAGRQGFSSLAARPQPRNIPAPFANRTAFPQAAA